METTGFKGWKTKKKTKKNEKNKQSSARGRCLGKPTHMPGCFMRSLGLPALARGFPSLQQGVSLCHSGWTVHGSKAQGQKKVNRREATQGTLN